MIYALIIICITIMLSLTISMVGNIRGYQDVKKNAIELNLPEHPWNWRVLLGPVIYFKWLDHRLQD